MMGKSVEELIDPILNVFGGADGGIGFAKLRHDFLPSLVNKADRTNLEESVLTMVTQFSRLCEEMLK
jgi:hypothetical protein